MVNIIHSQLNNLINQLTFDNKLFVKIYLNSTFYDKLNKYISNNAEINYQKIYELFESEYNNFLLLTIFPSITDFNTKLTVSEALNIQKFCLNFFIESKDLLFKILSEKIDFSKIFKFTYDKNKNISVKLSHLIKEELRENIFVEIMKEKNKVNEFYEFYNFYNNFPGKEINLLENKVFSNKELVKKIYTHNDKEIHFYFDKLSTNLEFFIVENYDLTNLDYNIYEEIDIKTITEEFKNSL